jgi:hypothetical protein
LGCKYSKLRRIGITAAFIAVPALSFHLYSAGIHAEIRSTPPDGIRVNGFNDHPNTLSDLVDLVSLDELERVVRGLSGADTIYVDGDSVVLKTRYAYAEQKNQALAYLLDEVAALGYEPAVQRFMLRVSRPDLTGLALSNSLDTVWIGGTNGAVYCAFQSDGWDRFEKCGDIGGKIFDMYVDPAGRLWAACGLPGGNYGALFISPDGGANWSLRKSGPGILSLTAIAFSGEHYGIACGAFGTALFTADGGFTWMPITPDKFRYYSLNDVASSEPFRFWIAASGGNLFETKNLGSMWIEHKLNTYYPLNSIAFADSLHGVVVGTGAAFYTMDGGENWLTTTVIPPPGVQPDLRCVMMYDTLRVVASGGRGEIFLSDNGGVDWRRVEDGCPENDDIAAIAFAGRELLWTAGRDEAQQIDITPLGEQCRYYQFGDTIWGKNIRFRVEGDETPYHRIVMCAHYDATSGNPYVCTPGADDNATGVAGVLASAGALFGASVSRTVEFVLFDAEEPGLLGSRYFTGNFDPGVTYDAVINLDMLGYDKHRDWSLKISGRADHDDSTLADIVTTAIDSLGLLLVPDYTTVPNLTSDHVAFHGEGIPGILLIESDRTQLNPGYHTCRDVADSVMFDYLTECTKAALASIALLAGYDFHGEDPTAVAPIALYQNYPNPFASNTIVSFTAPEASPVEIAVFDVLGRFVARPETYRVAGADSGYVEWTGRNRSGRRLASGVYFVRLRVGSVEAVRKAVLVR